VAKLIEKHLRGGERSKEGWGEGKRKGGPQGQATIDNQKGKKPAGGKTGLANWKVKE